MVLALTLCKDGSSEASRTQKEYNDRLAGHQVSD
jgi:hypothetical protein